MSAPRDRLTFRGWGGDVHLGQGTLCVLVEVESSVSRARIILSDKEAEALGRSLIRRARYAREVRT